VRPIHKGPPFAGTRFGGSTPRGDLNPERGEEHAGAAPGDLYQRPAVGESTDQDHIKRHDCMTHDHLNLSRIVPAGPVVRWDAPQGREALA
jgi:hypothetical protein